MIPWLVRPGDILLVGVLTTTPPTHQMGPAYIDENGTRSDTVQDKVNVPYEMFKLGLGYAGFRERVADDS